MAFEQPHPIEGRNVSLWLRLRRAVNSSLVAAGAQFSGKDVKPYLDDVAGRNGHLVPVQESGSGVAVAAGLDGSVLVQTLDTKGREAAWVLTNERARPVGATFEGSVIATQMARGGLVIGAAEFEPGKWQAFEEFDGKLRPLPMLDDVESSVALDVSDDGVIVGAMRRTGQRAGTSGFRYTPETGIEDLNDIIASPGTLHIGAAISITTRGQILATGLEQSDEGYLLLSPQSG